jgi:hypothetical protein
MALWDALTGKVYHWNTTRLEARRVVQARLQMFPPNNEAVRDFLFAHYYAFNCILGELLFSEAPDIRSRRYIDRVKSLNHNDLNNMAAESFCELMVNNYSNSQDEKIRDVGFKLILSGCSVYGRVAQDVQRWIDVYLPSDLEAAAGLYGCEVAKVMGIDPRSEYEMAPLMGMQPRINQLMYASLDYPNWNSAVSRELSRVPRLGGYQDCIMK